ncbi:PilZ domain-containing protein [Oceanisphaera ostreae]|uniref:PilZ domain-containing protein n=1 Tax=Oceanisphaera ostreae TaxID=914151 RepID=A0ABW3KIR5_9GAMM
MDLSPYKTLLNKLVPLSYHNDIDSLLDSLLPEADKDTRYRLQAELSRLTSPCLRVLDLRSLFPDKCQLVRHQGLDHMMPEPLARRFHTLLKDFNGEYSRGLYEVLLAELAALRKLPAQFNNTSWHLPALGLQRKESRLRFVTPVVLHLDNGKSLQGNSLDISPAGLLVQLADAVRLPEQIAISFPELAKQPNMVSLASPRRYSLKQDSDDLSRLKMQRLEDAPDWQQALSEFIEQNRPRYGLDAEDLYTTVKTQCWGQVLLETSLSLSLFFDEQGELQHILTNRYSSKTLAPWQQKQPGDLLTTLLSPERILQMSQQPLSTTLLYSFRRQGKHLPYYFVASQHELAQQKAFAVFINEGLKAGTLLCYYVSIRPLHYADQAVNALDLQGIRQLNQLKWQLWLTPLSIPIAPIAAELNIQQLEPFIRPLRQQTPTITPLGKQASKRQETRFKLQSALELTVAGKTISGHSEDLSSRGIKVLLTESLRLEVPCLISVHLTELNKRSPRSRLKNLPYRVVNISGDGKILHLRIEGAEETHAAYLFLTALFEQNQSKLRARHEAHHTPAWLTWLSRQTLQQPSSPTFLLARNESGFYLQGAISCPAQQSLMSFLSNEHQQAHLSRLVSRQLLQSTFTQLLRPDGRDHHYLEIWTASAAGNSGQSWLLVDPDANRRAFLQDSRHSKDLRVSLVIINRLQLRQLDYMVPEWEKLTQTSLYKAQQLEQQIAELSVLSQVFDITEMVLCQLPVKEPATNQVPLPSSAD